MSDVLVCTHCHSSVCTCVHAASYRDLHDELIVFDFGSKTTWFKYTGDAGIGQLSMHPTVGPLNSSSASTDEDLCPVCTRSSFHHSRPIPDSEATCARKSSAKTFSLRNLDCFSSSSSGNNDVECVAFSAVDSLVNTSSIGDQTPASEPDDVRLFEFLVRHITRRNPSFQISNIPFVICQSTDADEITRNRLTRMVICQLKVPE